MLLNYPKTSLIPELSIQANVRSATRMLALVVMTYLTANLLNVILSCWEIYSPETLYENISLYTFANDTVSLLTIVAGALRLAIYCVCSEIIRGEVVGTLKGLVRLNTKAPDQTTNRQQTDSPRPPRQLRDDLAASKRLLSHVTIVVF